MARAKKSNASEARAAVSGMYAPLNLLSIHPNQGGELPKQSGGDKGRKDDYTKKMVADSICILTTPDFVLYHTRKNTFITIFEKREEERRREENRKGEERSARKRQYQTILL